MSSRIDWTHPETGTLIDLWRQDHIQKQFSSMCRKKPIWEDISAQLRIKGLNRTGKQCEVRILTFTTKYRKVVKANKESGAAPKTIPFFDELDDVLGTRASTAPPCLIDSGRKSSGETLIHTNDFYNKSGHEIQSLFYCPILILGPKTIFVDPHLV